MFRVTSGRPRRIGGFVSLTEAFDIDYATGRALAGMLAVFVEFEREILRERVKAGIAQARAKGTIFGRPKSAARKAAEIKRLYRKEKLSKSEIARQLGKERGIRFQSLTEAIVILKALNAYVDLGFSRVLLRACSFFTRKGGAESEEIKAGY